MQLVQQQKQQQETKMNVSPEVKKVARDRLQKRLRQKKVSVFGPDQYAAAT